ncbi:PAS domain S-box protein [Perlabentimonas gracilis]|uniref:PAS domain S-box protein n=1 Tax=Perlabentimonas gracilis TaxID=2715279 RepID=UPI00140D7FC7|nr:PAS domain S-box protein [Perlabentimonas gracilis]NHB69686.1 PAS domain S-box protein [Perlabentimonas gracilis]
MISQTLVLKKYFEVKPWDGVDTIRPMLLRNGFAVVIDEIGFWGILTTNDIIKKNHRLVIDCLKPTIPFVEEKDSLPFVLDLMYSSNNEVLPYINQKKFIGVITRNQITTYFQNSTEQLNKAIAELNDTNTKLKESEEKYRLLVESLNEGVWQIDKNSNTVFVNRRMAQMLGYSIDEMLGKPNIQFVDPRFRNSITNIVDKNRDGIAIQREVEFIKKDGTRVNTIIETSPFFDDNGIYKGAIAGVLDISKRKKTENDLVQSEKMLKTIINSVPAAIFWKDSNSAYLGGNIRFAEYVGIPVNEISGKTDKDMPWKDFKSIYNQEDQSVFRTGKPLLSFEKVGKNLKGEHTWFRVSKVPLFAPNGKEIISVIGIFEDITDQKKRDNELYEYRNQLEQLVKERTFELQDAQRIANIGNWTYDIASGNLTWSDQLFHIYCKNKNSFTPKYSIYRDIVHPDDISLVSRIYFKSIENKESFTLEHRIVDSKGQLKWISTSCEHRFDENGNHIESIGTVQDITARKNLEIELKQKDSEFELFFENINDVVLIFDIDGNTIYANRVFEKVFGKTIAEQKQNPSSFLDSVHAEDIDKFSGFILEILTLHNSIADFNFEFRIHQGRDIKWLHLKGIPVADSDRKLIRLSLIITDITKTKQAQRDILSAMVHAEERERTRLAQDLHDGIGPLLSTTKLYLQLLSKPKSKINKESFAAQAEESIDEAISSVREISHNLSPSLLTRFGLTSAINSYIGRLRNSTNLRFTYNHNLQRPLNFEVETTIYRIVVECVNNAIRHAKASSINIEMNDNEEKILIAIADNGIGFDVEQTVKTKKGLGLVNINNRMENIGGKIEIKSAPRNGTQIKLTIPIDDNALR